MSSPKGLCNVGNTCYANSLLQALFLCKKFNTELSLMIGDEETLAKAYIALCNTVNRENLIRFIQKLKSTGLSVSRQNDAHEVILAFFRGVHAELIDNDVSKILNLIPSNQNIRNFVEARVRWLYKNDHSIINDYFCGNMLYIFDCDHCENKTSKMNRFSELILPVSDSIETSLYLYFSETAVESKCDLCGKFNKEKRTYVLNGPQYLFVVLKRYTENSRKDNGFVQFDSTLDLSKYMILRGISIKYELSSVICHSGGVNGGHYYSFNRYGPNWFLCNDRKIMRVPSLTDNFKKNAYVLVFKQVK